jgi:hypothetical protein
LSFKFKDKIWKTAAAPIQSQKQLESSLLPGIFGNHLLPYQLAD